MAKLASIPNDATHWGRRIALAVLVGIAAGLAAVVIEWGIHAGSSLLVGRFTHTGGTGFLQFHPAILLLPAGGALIAGLWVRFLAPDAHGHGVDVLTRAFHQRFGVLPLRGPATKGTGAVLVISTGGSAGPEGPIAALGAAIGSTLGGLFRIPPRERRILLIAGCAAGIGAIFGCPLGGALFATSILYREPEFESDSIVSSFVASVVGYVTFMVILGRHDPMFAGIDAFRFDSALDLIWYTLLGPLCALAAMLLSLSVRAVERGIVPRWRAPLWSLAALGGLATGAIACIFPQVMDGRFVFIENVIDGTMLVGEDGTTPWFRWTALLGCLLVAKCAATACTVGSGAPGGMLGPAVFIGGLAGAVLGAAGEAIAPGAINEDLRQALIPVGMAGVLAAAMRTPIAAMVMVTEMTASYGLVPPLMLVCAIAYIVGRSAGLNTQQVRSSSESPAHAIDPILYRLESWRAADLVDRNWPLVVRPETPLDEIIRSVEPGTRPVIAVTDGATSLLGVIASEDLSRVLLDRESANLLVASDVMTSDVTTIDESAGADRALQVFRSQGHDVVPVTNQAGHWIGMLTRRRIVRALQQEFARVREAALHEHSDIGTLDADMRVEQLLLGVPDSGANIERLFVPIEAVGRSLRECDFRRTYAAQVVAIEQRDGTVECPPDLDAPLRTDQRLIVVRAS